VLETEISNGEIQAFSLNTSIWFPSSDNWRWQLGTATGNFPP
jgi:hypothetical protein